MAWPFFRLERRHSLSPSLCMYLSLLPCLCVLGYLPHRGVSLCRALPSFLWPLCRVSAAASSPGLWPQEHLREVRDLTEALTKDESVLINHDLANEPERSVSKGYGLVLSFLVLSCLVLSFLVSWQWREGKGKEGKVLLFLSVRHAVSRYSSSSALIPFEAGTMAPEALVCLSLLG